MKVVESSCLHRNTILYHQRYSIFYFFTGLDIVRLVLSFVIRTVARLLSRRHELIAHRTLRNIYLGPLYETLSNSFLTFFLVTKRKNLSYLKEKFQIEHIFYAKSFQTIFTCWRFLCVCLKTKYICIVNFTETSTCISPHHIEYK